MRLFTGNTRLGGSSCCSQALLASVRSSSALNPEEAPLAVKKRKADFAFPRVTEVSVHPRWMWGGGVCQDDRASSLPSPVNLVHSVYHPSPWREVVGGHGSNGRRRCRAPPPSGRFSRVLQPFPGLEVAGWVPTVQGSV